jgi:hypothetical protein
MAGAAQKQTSVFHPVTGQHPLTGSNSRAETSPETLKLLEYVERSVDEEEEEEFRYLRFESLQRTDIVALEVKLFQSKAKSRSKISVADADIESLRETLHQYGRFLFKSHMLLKIVLTR